MRKITHDQAKALIMEKVTIYQLYAWKAEQVDFWEWLYFASNLTVFAYNRTSGSEQQEAEP